MKIHEPKTNALLTTAFAKACRSSFLWLVLFFHIFHFDAHSQSQLASDIVVNGVVADDKGLPVSGASVKLKDANNGATTNENGKYVIKVPSNATLVFTYVGFAEQQVPVGSRTVINVTLAATNSSLGEVVVVGYGTQKKVSLTGAVSQVKGSDLTKRTTSNIQQAMQGQVAGVAIMDQGAGPGKASISLRVRGITTLGNNEALVIVDGIEQRIEDINPEDIETISVLKDASSTAIYGSRAANGVVLITTKRANSGKLAISYHGYYGIQRSNNNPEHMGLEDYMRLQNVAYTNSFGEPIYTEDYIRKYVNATDRIKYPLPNTWFDAVLHDAPQISNALSFSGGNETIKARLSLRHLYQDGIIANSSSKVTEVRLNTDYKVSRKLTVSTDINYRLMDNLSPIDEYAVFNTMLQTSQWTVPRYPDGTYGISSDGHSPLLYAEAAGTIRSQNDLITGSIKADWDIVKGLKFSTQLAGSFTFVTAKDYRNSYEVRDYYNSDIIRKSVPINSMWETRNQWREYTINNLLTYKVDFNDHSLNLLAGYSQIQNNNSMLYAYRQGFYSNDIQSISAGVNDGTKTNDGNEAGWGLRSYFSRINYSYNNRYLFEANGRYDGSSRFLGDNRYSFFPSFSAGWRLSEEKFWTALNADKLVNELKIRGSWGKTGNQAVGLYSGLVTLSPTTYSFGGVSAQGYQQQTLANQDITWETTTQTDIGIDAELLNNRIGLTVDYYHKRTDDILLLLPVPGVLGLNPSYQNAGRMDNKGWEFQVSSRNMIGQLVINANVNLTINDNMVKDLAGTGPYINGGLEDRNIIGEGYPYGGYWGYITDGLFQSKDEVASYPNYRPGTAPGDVKIVDLNGDGKISPDDMTFLGRVFPRYTFGSNINLMFKGFALNMLFQGVGGSKTRLGGAIFQMGVWGGFTHKLIAGNYWTPENPNARFPRPLKFDTRNDDMIDRSLVDASYLRLKNIQLVYTIPEKLTRKAGMRSVSVYVAATNLLTFASFNEWDLDPETIPGTRTERYPQTSVTTFGLNVQF